MISARQFYAMAEENEPQQLPLDVYLATKDGEKPFRVVEGGKTYWEKQGYILTLLPEQEQ